MSPATGEMYTVVPHRMHDGLPCGTWHGRVLCVISEGRAIVQQMKIDGERWRPSMSTCVDVAALGPLAVDVDLFGDPIGNAR